MQGVEIYQEAAALDTKSRLLRNRCPLEKIFELSEN